MTVTDAVTTPVPDIDELRAQLTGRQFPGGQVRIAHHEAWLGHEAMDAPRPDDGALDPLWILVVGLRGMGVGIAGIIDWAEADPALGVLFGELAIEQRRPLIVDTLYDVSGEITAVTRRTGRRAGTFDRVEFVLRLATDAGADAVVTSSFLFRRAAA